MNMRMYEKRFAYSVIIDPGLFIWNCRIILHKRVTQNDSAKLCCSGRVNHPLTRNGLYAWKRMRAFIFWKLKIVLYAPWQARCRCIGVRNVPEHLKVNICEWRNCFFFQQYNNADVCRPVDMQSIRLAFLHSRWYMNQIRLNKFGGFFTDSGRLVYS